MRDFKDKNQIIENLSPPISINDFLTENEITELIQIYNNHEGKIYKNTGPVTVNVTQKNLEDFSIFQIILKRLEPYIGSNFEVYTSFFFYVEIPHIIHNDDSYDLPLIYKGITIPLELTYKSIDTGFPSLCFFDQYYLEGPSKFFNGSKNIPTYYNRCVYEYSQVYNKTNKPFDDTIREKYFKHLKKDWLTGLSFQSAQPWIPGNAIIFDCARLHAASDFQSQKIISKLGLSIFTKIKS